MLGHSTESTERALRPGGQDPLINHTDVQRVSQVIEGVVQSAPVEVGTFRAPAPVHDVGPGSLGLRASSVVHRSAAAHAVALNEADALRLPRRHPRIDIELAEPIERGTGESLVSVQRSGFQDDDSRRSAFWPRDECVGRRETGGPRPDDEDGLLAGEALRQAGRDPARPSAASPARKVRLGSTSGPDGGTSVSPSKTGKAPAAR